MIYPCLGVILDVILRKILHDFYENPWRTRLYDGSKKSGSKIAVEESSSDRRLRSKILRPVEESSTAVFERSLRYLFERSYRRVG